MSHFYCDAVLKTLLRAANLAYAKEDYECFPRLVINMLRHCITTHS